MKKVISFNFKEPNTDPDQIVGQQSTSERYTFAKNY